MYRNHHAYTIARRLICFKAVVPVEGLTFVNRQGLHIRRESIKRVKLEENSKRLYYKVYQQKLVWCIFFSLKHNHKMKPNESNKMDKVSTLNVEK